MKIGSQIKLMRKENGISQKELANLVGISNVSMNRIEKGWQIPSDATLTKIADALNTSTAILKWNSITINDIKPDKIQLYLILKPHIDALINELL